MMKRRASGQTAMLVSAWLGLTGCTHEGGASESGGENMDAETLAVHGSAPSRELDAGTRLFVPAPNPAGVRQVVDLLRARKFAGAARVAAMLTTPHSVWLTGGTPQEVKTTVKRTLAAADRANAVPVLVPYNLPYRDCQQYSTGGAADTAAYKAWIDAFAAALGRAKAIVILEPDSLGIIPYNTTIHGVEEWCKPTVTDENGETVPAPGATPEDRYAELRYAVEAILEKAPRAAVYLDGTHSAWLGVGEAAHRLYKAGFRDGVQRVQGFFVNASNHQATNEATQFGAWVSMCLAAGTPGVGPDWMRDPDTGVPHFDWCPSQYDSATNYESVNFTPEFAASVTASLEGLMAGASARVRFVIDTSRNGKGAWAPDESAAYPDPQTWCNPPGRGLGPRPVVGTENELVAAYLWVKTPGESDGSCNRGMAGSMTDPEWGGIVDPAAGQWFPAQALELARLASPPLF